MPLEGCLRLRQARPDEAIRDTRRVGSLPPSRGVRLEDHHLCKGPSVLSQLPSQDRKAGRVRSLATPKLGEFLTLRRAPGDLRFGLGAAFLLLSWDDLFVDSMLLGREGRPFHVGGHVEHVSRHMWFTRGVNQVRMRAVYHLCPSASVF